MNNETTRLQEARRLQEEHIRDIGVDYYYSRLLEKSKRDPRYKRFADGSISFNPYMRFSKDGRVLEHSE